MSGPRLASDPALVAVIRPAIDGVDCTAWIFRRGAASPSLEGTFAIPASGLAAALDARRIGRAMVLLPAGRVLARSCELPDAGDEQLRMALRLQAESQALGSTPEHRRAMAVLPRAGRAARSGLVLEWPSSDLSAPLPPALAGRRGITYASEPAALATLGSIEGVAGPLVAFDPSTGTVSLAVATPKGLMIRAAREDAGPGFADAVVRLVCETALHAGVDGEGLEALAARTRAAVDGSRDGGFGAAPDDLERLARATGLPSEPAWWREHGIVAGIAAGAFSPLASLNELRLHEPGEEPNAVGRLVNRLAEPEVLTWAIVAAAFLIVLGPLVFAWLDYRIMQWKVSSLGAETYRSAVAANEKLTAVYRERSTQAWPMTKLLADLACSTPEGIDLEQVNIVHNESISVRGQARRNDALSGPETILRMESLMQASGVFDRINKGWDAPNQMGLYDFSLSANVTRPTRTMALKPELDWAATPLVVRRYGPPKTNDGEAAPPSTPTVAAPANGAAPAPPAVPAAGSEVAGAAAPSGETPVVAAGNGSGNARAGSSEGARRAEDRGLALTGQPGSSNERSRRTGLAGSESDVPPPPLSDTEIAAMTREEALKAAGTVAKAQKNQNFDEETRARLKKEFEKVMEHLRTNR